LREKFTTKQDGKPMSESCRWQMEKVALGSFKRAAKPKQALIAKNALQGHSERLGDVLLLEAAGDDEGGPGPARLAANRADNRRPWQ
jgi:hypothetical protein